jgi:HAD superfamily hydrolase (TIGR01549 family)
VTVLKYKGIIFDLDSTLVESHVDFPKMKKKMIKLLEENGHPSGQLSPTDMTTVEIMERAEKIWEKNKMPDIKREAIRSHIEDYMNQGEIESIDNLKEIPGSSNAIKSLKSKGYMLAILTRSHHAYAVEALKKTSMYDSFNLILGRDETPRPKPYKEALEHTVKLMGLSIHEVIFVGDHQIDCDSAINSGCNFIGVATGQRGLKSWANGRPPEILLDSIVDLPEFLDY